MGQGGHSLAKANTSGSKKKALHAAFSFLYEADDVDFFQSDSKVGLAGSVV